LKIPDRQRNLHLSTDHEPLELQDVLSPYAKNRPIMNARAPISNSYNPILNPIPNTNQNPYIAKLKEQESSGSRPYLRNDASYNILS